MSEIHHTDDLKKKAELARVLRLEVRQRHPTPDTHPPGEDTHRYTTLATLSIYFSIRSTFNPYLPYRYHHHHETFITKDVDDDLDPRDLRRPINASY